MGFLCDRGRVVRHQHDAAVEVVKDVADCFVEPFDCFDLFLDGSEVACFVGCFNVHVYEVHIAFERFHCGFCFAHVVGVEVSGCTRYFYNFHSCTAGDAEEEVNCGDDGSFFAEHFSKLRHCGFCTAAPGPDHVCRVFACGNSGFVDGVVCKDVVGDDHKAVEVCCVFAGREVGVDEFADDVMRGFGDGAFAVWEHEDVAVGDARIEADAEVLEPFL